MIAAGWREKGSQDDFYEALSNAARSARPLLDGHEHTAQVAKAALGVLVRADSGHETYIALRILGSVPKNLLIVILDPVPGCDRNAWFPELAMRTAPWSPGNRSGRT